VMPSQRQEQLLQEEEELLSRHRREAR